MNAAEALKWFDKLAARTLHTKSNGHYELMEAANWTAQAQAALEAVFPKGHAILTRWEAVVPREQPGAANGHVSLHYVFGQLRATFDAAHEILREGRLTGLVADIQAATIEELLEQADDLLAKRFLAAASVVAGGALETHLRHLCGRSALTINGEGSITKYADALAQARNGGNEICSRTDTNLIKGWGSIRNEAAHNPGAFAHDANSVRSMIEGIRSFMLRVP